MPTYSQEVQNPDTGKMENYSVYSRDEISEDATQQAISNYLDTGKQTWSNGQGTVVLPPIGGGPVQSVGGKPDVAGTAGSYLKAQAAQGYDKYVAAPLNTAIDTIHGGIKSMTSVLPQSIQGGAATDMAANYAKEIANDPGMMALTVAGGAASRLGMSMVNPIVKLAPTLLGRFAQIVTPPAAAGAIYGGTRELFDPNATTQQNMTKAALIGTTGLALNVVLKGAAGMFKNGAGPDVSEGILDAIDKHFADLGIGAPSLRNNPMQAVEVIGREVNKAGQQQFTKQMTTMIDYVKSISPSNGPAFEKQVVGIAKTLTDLSKINMAPGTPAIFNAGAAKQYQSLLSTLQTQLEQSRDIVLGVGTGKGGVMDFATMGKALAQDPQFVQMLVNQKAITPNQASMLAQGNTSVFTKIDKSTGMPFWAAYATPDDMARVSQGSVAGALSGQGPAAQQQLQSQNVQALQHWYQGMTGLVQQKVALDRSSTITAAAIKNGYDLNPQQLGQAALTAGQRFDNLDSTTQRLLQSIYGKAAGRLADLSHDTYVQTAKTGWLGQQTAKILGTSGQPAMLLGNTGPINVEIARHLRKIGD